MGPTGTSRIVDGHVQNISSGGLCLLAQKRLKVSELLVGEIAVPGTRASIPTLLQVRWLSKNSFGPRYRAGLHFMLQARYYPSLANIHKNRRPHRNGRGRQAHITKRKIVREPNLRVGMGVEAG